MARPERLDQFLTVGTQLELSAECVYADGVPIDFTATGVALEVSFRKDWYPTGNQSLWVLSLADGSITVDPGNSSKVLINVTVPNVFESSDVKYVWLWDLILEGKRYPMLRGVVTVGY